ncbi:MAG: hypothetical protein LBR80_14725 [Deltaproteobacteria bacterium]|jgi:hypothetical protein|nr:hypothetical protein [Deltaproteobacteria bacterium]
MTREALTKNGLMTMVALRLPDIPPQVTRMAGDLIFQAIHDGLAEGRPVSLRGFGRLIPRLYADGSPKKLGLLFHPSPRLCGVSASGPAAASGPEIGGASGSVAGIGPETATAPESGAASDPEIVPVS